MILVKIYVLVEAGNPSRVRTNKKTPEMNKLDNDIKILKMGAHNFEKQKS